MRAQLTIARQPPNRPTCDKRVRSFTQPGQSSRLGGRGTVKSESSQRQSTGLYADCPQLVVSALLTEKCTYRQQTRNRDSCLAIKRKQSAHRQAESSRASMSSSTRLPSKRFHALLNSLFKVLCNFPSRYLFAIGLVVIFSLRMGFTTHFGLHSQATRLHGSVQPTQETSYGPCTRYGPWPPSRGLL